MPYFCNLIYFIKSIVTENDKEMGLVRLLNFNHIHWWINAYLIVFFFIYNFSFWGDGREGNTKLIPNRKIT